MDYNFFKWVLKPILPLVFVAFLLAACEKDDASTANLFQYQEKSAAFTLTDTNVSTTEDTAAIMTTACGTPAVVSAQWYWSNGCNCNVKFKCGLVQYATLYTWEIHQVYSWGVDPEPFFVKHTITNAWNWGGGYGQPDRFQVWVKAKCGANGYGQFKKSVTIVPPACCGQQ